MLKALSEFVIKVADLAEAEGRQLRAAVVALGVGFAVFFAAMSFLIIGVLLLVFALYKGLEGAVGPAWGALIAAGAILVPAALIAWLALRHMSRGGGES
jgi:hypothetical protein